MNIRILRNPTIGHAVEITIDGKRTYKDLSGLTSEQKTRLSHRLLNWRKDGQKGYPDLQV